MNRLLVLTELFLPTKGGTAVWAAEVYKRMGGKNIHIVAADVPGAEEVDAVHPNTVHRLNLKRVSWLRPESLAIYGRFLFKSLWLSLTRRFDAIHALRALPEGLVAWAVARLTFCPVVIYAHGEELTTWGRGNKYRAMRYALCHADKVIANSENTREELRRMGVKAEHIVLIHPGVDTKVFQSRLPCQDLRQSLGLAANQKLILSVGRLSRRKGFDRVIESLPQLVAQGLDAHVVLIGIGEDLDYLSGLASNLDMVDRVHFLGHVSPEDLPRWYNACDIFAMPNREIDGDNEGFGMVFLEAAACGKPTIAGRDGGTGSAVVEAVTGFRIDGKQLEPLVNVLAKLLGNTALAERMGQAGQARAHREFSWESVANKTHRIVAAYKQGPQ